MCWVIKRLERGHKGDDDAKERAQVATAVTGTPQECNASDLVLMIAYIGPYCGGK